MNEDTPVLAPALATAVAPVQAALAAPAQAGDYRCIVIDPPWDQGKTGKRSCRPNQGTTLDYPTMTPDEIKELPVAAWAADVPDEKTYLWLWATTSRSGATGRPIIQHGFELLEEWGFRYHIMLTWHKHMGPCPFSPYKFLSEHVLFAWRGGGHFPKEAIGQLDSVFPAKRDMNAHSVKPAYFYKEVCKHFPGPRLDMFARGAHEGFDGWGNEYEGNAK